MVFAENDEIENKLEIGFYWFEHLNGAFFAPILIMSSGRYPIESFVSWRNVIGGWMFFSLYMRYFLTFISNWVWVNLNHTLCSAENDPWKEAFDMGAYYYMWADFYLLIASFTAYYLISLMA